MKKGSSLPLVLIVVAFLLVPLGFWYFYSQSNSQNVKGARTSGVKGIYVTINSNQSTWDLMSYLCKDRSSCLATPIAGLQLETISGGQTDNYQVTIPYQSLWDQYTYLKFYVKSGWGNQMKNFNVIKHGEIPGSSVERITYEGTTYNLVIIPLSEIKDSLLESVEFSDQ